MWSLQSLGVPLVLCDKISLMIRKPRHVITPALLDKEKKSLYGPFPRRERTIWWYKKYVYPPNFSVETFGFFCSRASRRLFCLRASRLFFEEDPQQIEERRQEGIMKSLIKIGEDAKKRPKYAEKRVQTLFRGKNVIQSRNKHYLKPKCNY